MRSPRIPFLPALVVALLLVALGGAGIAAAAAPVAVDGDVTALAGPAEGHPIASIAGSIGRGGRGTAMLAPSGYAGRAGYARGEEALLIARRDGTILVLGGLGTKLTLRVSGHSFTATGVVGLTLRARRSVPVEAQGVVLSRRARPAQGQDVLVAGSPKGPLVDALAKRYHLVKFDAARHSRGALLANPDLYRRIAGVVVDGSLRPTDADAVSNLRGMFNSGRWVAASPRAATLSKVMYPVMYAHFRGSQGALIRSADTGNGTRARKHLVVLEPRVHWARTKYAQQVLKRSTPPPRAMAAARSDARRRLARALARGERMGLRAPVRPAKHELGASVSTAAGQGTCNGTITSGSGAAPAVYEICVNTTVSVISTSSSLLNPWAFSQGPDWCDGLLGTSSWCASQAGNCQASGGGWNLPGPSPWNCGENYGTMYWNWEGTGNGVQPMGANNWLALVPSNYPATLTQTSSVDFERVYTVSLAALGQGGYQQWLSETDGSTMDAVLTASAPVIQCVTGGAGGQVTPWTPSQCASATSANDYFPQGYYCGLGSSNSCQGGTGNTLSSQDPWQNAWWWEPTGTWGLEAGFALGAALHLASFSYQPQQGQSAQPQLVTATGGTSPLQGDVQANVAGSTSSSSSSWNEHQNTKTWNIQGNVDASCNPSDCEASGQASASISGGYSNTTTTSSGSSTVNNYSTGANQTVANWVTSEWIGTTTGADSPCTTPPAVAGTTTIGGPCSAWLLDSAWMPSSQSASWSQYVPNLEFTGQPALGTSYPLTCAPSGAGCFNTQYPSQATPYQGWGAGQNVGGLLMASVATFGLEAASSGTPSVPYVGTVTPSDEDTLYLVDQLSPGPLGTSAVPNSQAQVLGVRLNNLGSSATVSCWGACANASSGPSATVSGPPTTLVSTFTLAGQSPGATNQLAMSDLDLCAPPVVTAQSWQAGCDADPAYNSLPPQTWAPIPLCVTSACAAGGTPLQVAAAPPTGSTSAYPPYDLTIGGSVVCGPGSWSAAESYAYQWMQWTTAKGQNAWVPVTAGVSSSAPNTLTPPQGSVGNIYMCQVTATGTGGSTTASSPSFTTIQ